MSKIPAKNRKFRPRQTPTETGLYVAQKQNYKHLESTDVIIPKSKPSEDDVLKRLADILVESFLNQFDHAKNNPR